MFSFGQSIMSIVCNKRLGYLLSTGTVLILCLFFYLAVMSLSINEKAQVSHTIHVCCTFYCDKEFDLQLVNFEKDCLSVNCLNSGFYDTIILQPMHFHYGKYETRA